MTTAASIVEEPDSGAVARRAAEHFTATVATALAQRGVAHVALAGGTTPAATYALLDPTALEGVELWFGDERCVAPDDPDSNFGMVVSTLRVERSTLHRIEGERGAEAAADSYEAELRASVPADESGWPVLDLLLLGIGEDGHTASLFPDNPALFVEDRAVLAVHDAPKPPPDRVSLSLPVLRAARRCVLLATGASKAAALASALGEPTARVPSSLLARERLIVIADAGALGAR
jgi:6-phosphogluconolactonase